MKCQIQKAGDNRAWCNRPPHNKRLLLFALQDPRCMNESVESDPTHATWAAYWYCLIQPFIHHVPWADPRGYAAPHLHVKHYLIEHAALQRCSHFWFMDEIMAVQVADRSTGRFSDHNSLLPQGGSPSLSPLELHCIGLYIIVRMRLWTIFHLKPRCSTAPLHSLVPCSDQLSSKWDCGLSSGLTK